MLLYDMPFGEFAIHSENVDVIKEVGKVIRSSKYKNKFSNEHYNLFIEDGLNFEPDTSYRAMQMKRGIYLGHNIGDKCYLKIDGKNIYLYSEKKERYQQILWNFVLKYIFTKVALDNDVLHAKGLLLKNKEGRLFVLFGKGGSGKTSLAKKLSCFGCTILSNTHCFIKGKYVWGVDSWIRERTEDNIQIFQFNNDINEDTLLDGIIDQQFILNYNKEKIYKCYELNKSDAFYYLDNYAAAINNYDLKEEVWDYFSNEFSQRMSYFKKEETLLKNITDYSRIYYISVDIMEENSLNQFLKEFI